MTNTITKYPRVRKERKTRSGSNPDHMDYEPELMTTTPNKLNTNSSIKKVHARDLKEEIDKADHRWSANSHRLL